MDPSQFVGNASLPKNELEGDLNIESIDTIPLKPCSGLKFSVNSSQLIYLQSLFYYTNFQENKYPEYDNKLQIEQYLKYNPIPTSEKKDFVQKSDDFSAVPLSDQADKNKLSDSKEICNYIIYHIDLQDDIVLFSNLENDNKSDKLIDDLDQNVINFA